MASMASTLCTMLPYAIEREPQELLPGMPPIVPRALARLSRGVGRLAPADRGVDHHSALVLIAQAGRERRIGGARLDQAEGNGGGVHGAKGRIPQAPNGRASLPADPRSDQRSGSRF